MKRFTFLTAGLAVLAAVLFLELRWYTGREVPADSWATLQERSALILDAGHGGEDGGAVSLTGISESQINLAIVQKLDGLLGLYGEAPVLLRSEDVSLHDQSAVTIREKKVSDLKNRVAAIQAVQGGTLLSIHQNSYPEERYRGAQTFYAPTEGSKPLAEYIQQSLCQQLQPDNGRQVKQIPDTVYLMNHISCRAVLVECGFLTNREEEALLRDAGYQKKLAIALTSAWLTFPEK